MDQDLLGLAKLLVQLRSEVTYPGDPGGVVHRRQRPPSPTNVGDPDVEWIPVVAARGWLIISRDGKIQTRYAEIAAVRDNNAGMVRLVGEAGHSTWHQLEAPFWR